MYLFKKNTIYLIKIKVHFLLILSSLFFFTNTHANEKFVGFIDSLQGDAFIIKGEETIKLNEFDQIFIELKSEKWKIRAGDVDLNNSNTYFGKFEKRIQGLLVSAKINETDNAYVSGAIVKGQFKSSIINIQDGNQGPYKLQGQQGELYILVVSGSEKVYANGLLLQRGENKDYIINYNAGEIIFNTTYPVRSDMRVKVEYQISDRNYSRFMAYSGGEFSTEKMNLNVMIYNENDLKNQQLQQNLNSENIDVLSQAGDDLELMQSSSIIEAEFDENRILYFIHLAVLYLLLNFLYI